MRGRGGTISPNDTGPSDGTESSHEGDLLTEDFIRSVITEDERVRAGFVNPDGITRIDSDGSTRISRTIVMVLTDRRVGFATPDREYLDGGSLAYGEFAAIEFEHGRTVAVRLTASDGLVWHFGIPDADAETIESVEKHLTWIGDLRGFVSGVGDDVDLAASRIRESADAGEWQSALDLYEETRDKLDRAIVAVQVTTPVADHVLAPELTELARTLEDAHVRLYIERARARLDRGLEFVEDGAYDRAQATLEQAQADYERARDQRDVVKRSDEFQFGTQRELAEDMESLGWDLASAAGEPLHRANEARNAAREAEEPETARKYWQEAFDCYTLFLELDLGDDERSFADDASKVLDKRREAASRLIEIHNEIARETWNAGAQRQRDGDPGRALTSLVEAHRQLGTARDLAEEYNPVKADEFESQLDRMAETIESLRDETGRSAGADIVGDESDGLQASDSSGEEADDAQASDSSGEEADDAQAREAAGNDLVDREEDTDDEQTDDESELPVN